MYFEAKAVTSVVVHYQPGTGPHGRLAVSLVKLERRDHRYMIPQKSSTSFPIIRLSSASGILV